MKRFFVLLAVLAALISCNDALDQEPSDAMIRFDLHFNQPNAVQTKAVKTSWENGDVIYVFFDNIQSPKYLKMTYNGTEWSGLQMNGSNEEPLGLSNGDDGNMRAVYLPFACDASVSSNVDKDFVFDRVPYSYYLSGSLSFVVADNKVSGTLNMSVPEGFVQFFLDNDDASNVEIELREPHLTPVGVARIDRYGNIILEELAHGAPMPGYIYDKANKAAGEKKGYLFSGILAQDVRNASTTYHFTLVSGGFEGNYYNKVFADKTLYTSEQTGRAINLPALTSWTTLTTILPIDLGTDADGKRIYWSTCNVDATSPEEAGGYYAFGEVVTKTRYAWDSYQWCNGTINSLTKYNQNADYGVVDNKDTLDPADDVATVRLGGLWRIPTTEELERLSHSTDYVQASINGVNGYMMKSRISNAYIFLPLAGFWFEDRYFDNCLMYRSSQTHNQGSYKSSYYSGYLNEDGSILSVYWTRRSDGFSVRPVSD